MTVTTIECHSKHKPIQKYAYPELRDRSSSTSVVSTGLPPARERVAGGDRDSNSGALLTGRLFLATYKVTGPFSVTDVKHTD